MKRLVLVLCLCGALAIPAAAAAGPAFRVDHEFRGLVQGDPNTYFGFDLGGTERKKVRHVVALLPVTCYSGNQGIVPVWVRGSFTVGRLSALLVGQSHRSAARAKALAATSERRRHHHRRIFIGEADVDTSIGQGEAYLFGLLRRHGKATGYIQVDLNTDSFGKCYSGGLTWRAHRGAHVDHPPAP